jgi:hypothetical protein
MHKRAKHMKGVPDIVISDPYHEHQFYLGMSGSGKTNLLAYHLSLSQCRYTVFDTVGALSRILKPLYPSIQKIINPLALGFYDQQRQALFNQTCQNVLKEKYHLFIIDEVQEFCSKRAINPYLKSVITTGRNFHVSMFGTSQNVSVVNNIILSNIRHFWIFRSFIPTEKAWLSTFIPDATMNMRDALPPFGYVYYHTLSGKSLICDPVKKMDNPTNFQTLNTKTTLNQTLKR